MRSDACDALLQAAEDGIILEADVCTGDHDVNTDESSEGDAFFQMPHGINLEAVVGTCGLGADASSSTYILDAGAVANGFGDPASTVVQHRWLEPVYQQTQTQLEPVHQQAQADPSVPPYGLDPAVDKTKYASLCSSYQQSDGALATSVVGR